jgi:hypothetical protein
LDLDTTGVVGRGAVSTSAVGGQDAFGDRLRAVAWFGGNNSAEGRVHGHVP